MAAAALAKFLCFRKCWHMLSVVWRLWLVFLGSSSPKPTDDQSWILSMWEWNVRLVTMEQNLSCCWGIFWECSEYVSLWYCEIYIWSSLDSCPTTLKPWEGPKGEVFFRCSVFFNAVSTGVSGSPEVALNGAWWLERSNRIRGLGLSVPHSNLVKGVGL